jgi:CubicO group peptidase (beta-lactamase class C family)
MIARNPGSLYGRVMALSLGLAAALPQGLPGQAEAEMGGGSATERTRVDPPQLLGPDGGLDRAALARYIDGVVEAQLRLFDLPGAAVVVVHRGEVVHSRGYGYADIESRRRFDSRTVFRTASVSKLFTATAVMQLVERGLIDLDEDVSTYVDIAVPTTYPAPVTMRHLLTHTGGFDDRMLGTSASKHRPEDVIRVRDFLTSHDAAPRVRPPGMLISYSNHGMALAGYVVERLSGKSFEDYVDDHIHRPLGMVRSTFYDPLPDELAPDRARAYLYRRGRHEAFPITFENGGPAGSQFSTADDIARFMLANLGDGSLDGVRVLKPGTLRQLHATAFTHHPLLPGWTLGFMEYHWHGYRLVGHGGDIPGYHNQLSLLPDAQLGVLVHYNGVWAVDLDDDPRMRVVEAVLAALGPTDEGTGRFPAPAGVSALIPTSAGNPAAAGSRVGAPSVAGNYRITRHAVTSMEKLLLPNSFLRLHVREHRDGSLRIAMPLGLVGPSDWIPVGPLLYQRVGGGDYLAFGTDDQGRTSHLYGTFVIPLAFERVRWYEGELVLLGLLTFAAVTFLGVSLGWPARTVMRRIRRRPDPTRSIARRRRMLLARAVAGLGALVLMVLGVMIVQAMTLGDTPLLALQPFLALLVAGCGLLSIWLGYSTVRSWRAAEGPVAERLVHAVVALAGILFLWQMRYWNVLGF